MNKTLFSAALALGIVLPASADIEIVFPQDAPEVSAVTLVTSPINSSAFSDGEKMHKSTVTVIDGKASNAMESMPAKYYYSFVPNSDEVDLEIFAAQDDKITVTLKQNPQTGGWDYDITGSLVMEDLNGFQKAVEGPLQAYRENANDPTPQGQALVQNAIVQYNSIAESFVGSHLDSPAAPLLITEIDDPELGVKFFEAFGANAKNSFLMPYADSYYKRAKQKLEYMSLPPLEGNPAPAIVLKDLGGKEVSLDSFRGKWVIIDFWGSWCRWCIKGFPELKEAHEKYKGRLEVVGVDCRDSQEAWRAAVEKYQLPWVQLYNPGDNDILSQYRVEGFPTKAIIDPEGKVAAIVVGEDPAFYTKLDELMNP